MSNKKQKTFSISEAAEKLGMTRAGIHIAIKQGRLKAKQGTFTVERLVKTKMRGTVIRGKDLEAFQISYRHQDAGRKNG